MKKISISIALTLYACTMLAQQDTSKTINLQQVVISGNKFAEKKKNIVQQIDIISAQEIQQMNAQNSADVLLNTGQVFVQKSQQGGGSPVLRGFETSRIQLNIDGMRYNNALFRAGHLQNIIAVDPFALAQIEVLQGPASTIHGSDALGGVIVLKTISPKFSSTNKWHVNGLQATVRYSSANQEKTANVGFHVGNNKLASFTNITYSDFGDLVQGKNGPDSIVKLWTKKFIVERINNRDTMIENANRYKQVSTAYNQMDVLEKITFKQNNHITHHVNLQLSNSSNIPRYDRLTETSNGIAKNAEWYYGPQVRTLAAYTFEATSLSGFFNDININIHHQFWNESRHNRSFNKTSLNHRDEKINVMGYSFAFRHKTEAHELTLGTDGQLNSLKSIGTQENIVTGESKTIDSRYPDGNNQMQLLGLFLQHIFKNNDGKLIINDGIRASYSNLHSTIVDTSIMFRLPFTNLTQQNKAITGNIGIAYMPSSTMRLSANISSGFRSPNFDDMTKVFESVSGQRLIVPNTNLKPELTRNLDINIEHYGKVFSWQVYGYYTIFANAIVTDKFTYNGQDSVLYQGNMTAVYASQNKAKAFIYGGGVKFQYRPENHLLISGNAQYTYGRYDQDTILIPLDHIPPVTARLGIQYQAKKGYGEIYSLMNGAKKLNQYNLSGEDNLPYATPNGTPAWATINARVGVEVYSHTHVQLGVENITDRNYRYFASGMSAPGRNLVLAIRYLW